VNDWAKNPSFVVVALKMQSYLATAKRLDDPRLVGTPLDLRLEATRYMPDVSFVAPGERAGSRQRIERQAMGETNATTLSASLGRTIVEGRPRGETDHAGIYEAWIKTTKGETEVRRWALNVDPDEGDLAQTQSADLVTRLDPATCAEHARANFSADGWRGGTRSCTGSCCTAAPRTSNRCRQPRWTRSGGCTTRSGGSHGRDGSVAGARHGGGPLVRR